MIIREPIIVAYSQKSAMTPYKNTKVSCSFTGRRIEYKLCCILHSVHTRRCPAYLKNTVQLAVARQSRSDLRSSSTSAYLLPRLKTKFGERAFSHAGPSAWNALPTHIRDVPNSDSFRKLLKTRFFSLAFNVH